MTLNFYCFILLNEQDLTQIKKEEENKMYHGRFKNSHYEAGFNWGNLLYKHGKKISNNHTFIITEEICKRMYTNIRTILS